MGRRRKGATFNLLDKHLVGRELFTRRTVGPTFKALNNVGCTQSGLDYRNTLRFCNLYLNQYGRNFRLIALCRDKPDKDFQKLLICLANTCTVKLFGSNHKTKQ